MKNSEFVELFNGLAAVQQLKGVKFGLLVSKNVKALEKKNAKLIQERKDQLAELEKLMEEEVELELLEIPEDCLPENISGEQIINIDKIIA